MSEPTKIQRWLDLIAFLIARRLPVSYDELMSGVPAYAREYHAAQTDTQRQSLRRKFERDKDELRAEGIPLRTIRYTVNFGFDAQEGYQIDGRDFYLPYLRLVAQGASPPVAGHDRHRPATVAFSEEEAPLALDAVRRVAGIPAFPLVAEARSAFRKLAYDLDPDAFSREAKVLFIDPPGSAELGARVRTLSDALLARRRVSFRYHGMYRNEVTEREVAPYGLLFQRGTWYLVGHDALRDAVRVFRLGRMENVVARRGADATGWEIPADFSLDEYADREAWELGEPEETPVVARVRFGFPLSLWAERNDHGELVGRGSDGSQVRTFELQQVSPFLRWLLGLEGRADILEPAELQEELRTMARAAAEANAPRQP